LQIAARSYELSGLGYVGVDLVLDEERGALVLELNARPGLAIQIANGNGLRHRLDKVEALKKAGALSADPDERVAFSRANFHTT
jgi:glutathione synthase/RimK-type ligase-like ATP-grasp enzyme